MSLELTDEQVAAFEGFDRRRRAGELRMEERLLIIKHQLGVLHLTRQGDKKYNEALRISELAAKGDPIPLEGD